MPEVSAARFYCLPKTHKPIISLRPIVSIWVSRGSSICVEYAQVITRGFDIHFVQRDWSPTETTVATPCLWLQSAPLETITNIMSIVKNAMLVTLVKQDMPYLAGSGPWFLSNVTTHLQDSSNHASDWDYTSLVNQEMSFSFKREVNEAIFIQKYEQQRTGREDGTSCHPSTNKRSTVADTLS